jgi:hypothetical protein
VITVNKVIRNPKLVTSSVNGASVWRHQSFSNSKSFFLNVSRKFIQLTLLDLFFKKDKRGRCRHRLAVILKIIVDVISFKWHWWHCDVIEASRTACRFFKNVSRKFIQPAKPLLWKIEENSVVGRRRQL